MCVSFNVFIFINLEIIKYAHRLEENGVLEDLQRSERRGTMRSGLLLQEARFVFKMTQYPTWTGTCSWKLLGCLWERSLLRYFETQGASNLPWWKRLLSLRRMICNEVEGQKSHVNLGRPGCLYRFLICDVNWLSRSNKNYRVVLSLLPTGWVREVHVFCSLLFSLLLGAIPIIRRVTQQLRFGLEAK